MGLRDRIKRLERATKEARDMEALASTFMAVVKRLRAQGGGATRHEAGVQQHRIVGVANGKCEVDRVEDLSEE